MGDDKYCFEIGEQGQQGLGILDYLFNESTQQFLLRAGLKPNMKVLDIGCGLGTMTAWLSHQVLPGGTVTAIDNNEFQVQATLRHLEAKSVQNARAVCLSAYDIESLNEKFDLVYCRFILHHLSNPQDVIKSVYNILTPHGVFVSEEGLVSQAFSYPFSSLWGNERWNNHVEDYQDGESARDANFGMKLYHALHEAGFTNLHAKLVQPVITKQEDKDVFIKNMFNVLDESKASFINDGHSEEDWLNRRSEIKKLGEDSSQLFAFYQSCQVNGTKLIP